MSDASDNMLKQVQQQVLGRWELAVDATNLSLDQSLCVAFLGSASSGKDSAIRALFGLDFGEVDPIPGSTDRVRVAAIDQAGKLLVVNAPGFGDLRSDVAKEAERALERLDIAVYVVNCDGGATIDERRDLDRVRALGRPVLVCLNKIDLIRPHQREPFVKATLLQLGVDEKDAVITAFDPMPALSDEPIGVDAVVEWIHGHLVENGKGLLFVKNLRNRAMACEPIIRSAAKKAALAGAIPIPGADMTAVTALQVKLITEIAAVHNKQMNQDLILFVLGEALAGTAKGFIRWGVKAMKAAGWIPGGQIASLAIAGLGATIAAASTYGVGRAALVFMQRDGKITGAELRDIFDAEATNYRRHVINSEDA